MLTSQCNEEILQNWLKKDIKIKCYVIFSRNKLSTEKRLSYLHWHAHMLLAMIFSRVLTMSQWRLLYDFFFKICVHLVDSMGFYYVFCIWFSGKKLEASHSSSRRWSKLKFQGETLFIGEFFEDYWLISLWEWAIERELREK